MIKFKTLLITSIATLAATLSLGVISACGHTHEFGEWETITDATCTENGKKQRQCGCGEKEEEQIPATGHNYSNGFCLVCNEKQNSVENEIIEASDGLMYALNQDGESFSIVGVNAKTENDLIIPSSYNNLPVTAIGDMAFSGVDDFNSITIPESITKIGKNAFSYASFNKVNITSIAAWCAIDFFDEFSNPIYYATGLHLNGELITDLVIPDGVTSICDYAFYYCRKLESVTIPNSVIAIGLNSFYECNGIARVNVSDIANWCAIDFYGFSSNPLSTASELYLNGELLTNLVIPYGVSKIGNYAFYMFNSLTSISIPDSVTEIGNYAFNYCLGLTTVSMGKGVTKIGEWAFFSCSNLENITMSNSLTLIENEAFAYCTSLTDIIIPKGVNSIKKGTFRGCSGLKNLSIPDGLTSIGVCSFQDCNNLTNVNFGGTIEEWNAIEKGESWDAFTGNYSVICINGTIN